MNKATLAALLTLAASTPAYAQVIDKNANTGVINREATSSDLGQTKMIGEDPLEMNLKAVQVAFDKSDPTANVVTFTYNEKTTYKIRTRLGVRTMIRLDANETIDTYLIGNPTVFNAVQIPKDQFKDGVIPNIITVKPQHAGADTNLTLIGRSGKIYNFYLRADPINSETVPHFTVNIVNKEPEAELKEQLGIAAPLGAQLPAMQEPSAVVTPSEVIDSRLKTTAPYTVKSEEKPDYLKTTTDYNSYNFKYKAYGSDELAPAMVYDDGNFTYFDFRDRLSSDRLPVVFKVVDGYDTIVNTRMEKGFLIAESLSKEGWNMKNGEKHTCIKPNGPVGAKQRENKNEKIIREYQNMSI